MVVVCGKMCGKIEKLSDRKKMGVVVVMIPPPPL